MGRAFVKEVLQGRETMGLWDVGVEGDLSKGYLIMFSFPDGVGYHTFYTITSSFVSHTLGKFVQTTRNLFLQSTHFKVGVKGRQGIIYEENMSKALRMPVLCVRK